MFPAAQHPSRAAVKPLRLIVAILVQPPAVRVCPLFPWGRGQRAQQGRYRLSGRSSPVLSPRDFQQNSVHAPKPECFPARHRAGSKYKNEHLHLKASSRGTTAHLPFLSHQQVALIERF